jgi:RecB family endonuclease NucS
MFKKGSKYSRKDVGEIFFPGVGRPNGGDWDTGYVRVENDLIVFMNIGVPGRHSDYDYDNRYDEMNETIIWYGKPKAHSNQPTFQKIFSKELTPHFFARWDSSNPQFTYLGIGNYISYEDNHKLTKSDGTDFETIQVKFHCQDAGEILPITREVQENYSNSSFGLERHMEDFLVKNWQETMLSDRYDIYEENGVKIGRQYRTRSGPLDILAISKDKTEFLVIELKKGRTSDVTIGQTQRYMGFIKQSLANDNQQVKGCIIAFEDDQNIRDALHVTPDISFMKYELKFNLISIVK